MSRPALTAPILALSLVLLATTRVEAQQETERARALENGTRVPTCDAILQRNLEQSLQMLRDGREKAALQRMLPALRPTGPRPQLRYGERETRDFHELLDALLAALPDDRRQRFTVTLEGDATRALELARSERDGRVNRLRAIMRAFPGTRAAGRARAMLVDLAIERGDVLGALRHADGLSIEAQRARAAAIESLRSAERGADPWPHVAGDVTGLPLPGAQRAPRTATPRLLGGWPQRASWNPARASGVVGSLATKRSIAVFQDPHRLLICVDIPGTPRFENLDLRSVTTLGGDDKRTPSPAIRGSRVFLVHGGAIPSFVPPGSDAKAPAAELFAFDVGRESTRLAWRLSPRSIEAFGEQSSFLPVVCASGDQVYALVEVEEDRLTRRVHACAFSTDGELRWERRIAKGATLTANLLMHRQEALRAGRVVVAPPVLRDGRLFVESGLGITAALDARDGTMLWSFRTARLGKLRGRESTWEEGKLATRERELWLTPSDGMHAYRLRTTPSIDPILISLPEPRGSRARFVGIAPEHNASYWWCRGLLESTPRRVLLRPEDGRDTQYDAPPLDRGDRLAATPLLTGQSLVFATRSTLAWLDLEKDLFYERIFDLSSIGRSGFGPALPFRGGVIFACDLGPLFWSQ